tara:strand:- start:259 stop:471 length:213 start_codon:yes stop_codon:yes gene_type:complete
MQKNILIIVIIALAVYFGYSSFQGNESVEVASESTPLPDGVKAFHPTDDISSQAQGGKGETSDGSEAQLP